MKNSLRMLALCLLLLAMLVCAAQADEITVLDVSAQVYQAGGMPGRHFTPRDADLTALKDKFAACLTNHEDDLDIAEFSVSRITVQEVFTETLNDHPEFFYVQNAIGYYGDDESFVPMVRFLYVDYTDEELARMVANYNAEIDRAVRYAAAGKTPLMKAILVSDYFALNYHYDFTYTSRSAYTLFTQKTGVCQAYMMGYCAVLQRLGIPVETVNSVPMNHTWNLVQIDGEWYHVDTTWNDPSPDTPGAAHHAYMLRSDAGFENNPYGNPHSDWVPDNDIVCSSTKYDDAPWCGMHSPVIMLNGEMVITTLENNMVNICTWKNGITSTLHSFTGRWYITTTEDDIKKGMGYTNNLGSIGLYGNDLLYTTYNTCEAMSLTDGSVRVLYTAPELTGIWSSYFEGNVLHCSLGTDFNKITSRETIPLDLDEPAEVEQIVLPDDLLVIEVEAFAGTKVEVVVAGSSLQRIESRAFANCAELAVITLGSSVTGIADDAFDGCAAELVFVCPQGSDAEAYAAAHGFEVLYQ